MLSMELIPYTGRKMCFPAFDWLDDLPADDWPGHFQDWHTMQLTHKELAERSGLERYEDAVEAFRAWAFAHVGRRYAILWSSNREPEDPVMIAMLEAERARLRTPAKDPQVEGWMW